jgi:integrase
VPITRDEAVVGYTCPDCPETSEPIRRVENKTGVRFRAVVDATPPGAAKRQQVTHTVTTLTEAREWVAEVRAEVAHAGAYQRDTAETVAELCARWLQSRRDVRQVTVEGYRHTLTPVLRRIGSRPVTELTVADVEALTEWLGREGGRPGHDGQPGKPLGPRAVRAALVALAQAVGMAEHEGTVTRNVVRLAKRPRVRQRRGRDLEHWQPGELVRFRDHTDTDALAGAWRLTLSGMTRADVMGLRWSDVNLETGVANVAQGRVVVDGGSVTDDPKSAQRVRAVPFEAIHPGTVTLLRRMKAQQAADRLAAGTVYMMSGYVVVDALGRPLRPEVYSDRFRRLCTAAGVPSIHLHSVRHSLAFWLHQLGVAPADAAALLGHTTEVHLATYLPYSGVAGIAAAARALGAAQAGTGSAEG